MLAFIMIEMARRGKANDTYRLQPQQTLGDGLVVEQEAAEEQGEEHDEHAEQVGNALVADDDSEE